MESLHPIAREFADTLGGDPTEWSALLAAWHERVTIAWPDLGDPPDGFFRHALSHLEPSAARATAEAMHVEDLFLAYCCSQAIPNSLEKFEGQYSGELAAALAKLKTRAPADEARQLVWRKLFVTEPGKRLKILDYSGKGALRSWYRVALVRTLLDELRREGAHTRAVQGQAALGVPTPPADPETEYLRRLYQAEFQVAFEASVRALSAEDRNVLRAYYAENMTVDQIATAFGIHRATAARRVTRARDGLLAATRKRLQAELKISDRELDSVMRLIQSQLHASVARLFDEE